MSAAPVTPISTLPNPDALPPAAITRLKKLFGGRVPGAGELVARTIWAEARGDGAEGMSAVASCIMTRAAHPRWWGRSVAGVCVAPWQFSCWNDDDPNLPKLVAVTEADRDFAHALGIADDALAGRLADTTGGADSYYDIRMATPPAWARTATETAVVRNHRYMRVVLPAPGARAPAPIPPPNMSRAAEMTADDLNARELARVRAQGG